VEAAVEGALGAVVRLNESPAAPVFASQCSMRRSFGPTHPANSSGSIWARKSCSGVAEKSRVMRMLGSFASASMARQVVGDEVTSENLESNCVDHRPQHLLSRYN
jgi:hypothetical protein